MSCVGHVAGHRGAPCADQDTFHVKVSLLFCFTHSQMSPKGLLSVCLSVSSSLALAEVSHCSFECYECLTLVLGRERS